MAERASRTGIGFLDHLLTLLAFHAGVRPRLSRRAATRRRRAPHRRGRSRRVRHGADRRRSAAREGVARYGSAVVPMDEARATAAVDLVRRAHAEIALAFSGERVGGLAVTSAPARARTVRDGGRLHDPCRGDRRGRPSRRRGGLQGARSRAAVGRARRARRASVRRRASREASCSPTTARATCAASSAAFEREGVDATVTVDADDVARAPLAVIAGVGHVESAAAGSRANGLDEAIRGRVARGAADGRHLRRHAAPVRRERGGWRRPRAARRRRPPCQRAAGSAHGLEHARRAAEATRSSTGSRARTSTSPTVMRPVPDEEVAVATVDHGGPIAAAVQWGRWPACSSIPSAAAPPARASSRT